MEPRPWYWRLFCWLGFHRWTPSVGEPPRRTCIDCGRWERYVDHDDGVGMGRWVEF